MKLEGHAFFASEPLRSKFVMRLANIGGCADMVGEDLAVAISRNINQQCYAPDRNQENIPVPPFKEILRAFSSQWA